MIPKRTLSKVSITTAQPAIEVTIFGMNHTGRVPLIMPKPTANDTKTPVIHNIKLSNLFTPEETESDPILNCFVIDFNKYPSKDVSKNVCLNNSNY